MAHALAQRYDLPIPLGFFLAAAGAVVAASFIILAWFARPAADADRSSGERPPIGPLVSPAAQLYLAVLGRMVGVVAYLLIVAAGFFGPQDGLKNIAPVTIWVVWWVGFAFVCALVGNAWPAVNPLATLYTLIESAVPARAPRYAYPAWLGAWPAVGFLLMLLWMELVWDGAEHPATLACVFVAYSLITWAGMALFGRAAWLHHGEVFNVFFGVIGRFAPISAGGDDRHPAWHLRPPGAGLLADLPVDGSRLAFIVIVLAAVTYDGFLETPLWGALVANLAGAPDPADFDLTQDPPAIAAPTAFATLGLFVFPVLFYLVFILAIWVMRRLAARAEPPGVSLHLSAGMLARHFVVTLVPIAIAYHFAHYLAYLLLAGQLAIPLLSDPFGLGWDLFGTALYRLDIGVIDAKSAWYIAVMAIVLGHILAVWLAHVLALRLFPAHAASRSQMPMLVLMVLYTMTSLWILAQPVVADGGLT